MSRRIYYTAQGEVRSLRPYRYKTADGEYWTFYARNRQSADDMAVTWARRRTHGKIYKVKKRR